MAISEYLKNLRHVMGTELLQMAGVNVILRDEQERVLLVRHADDGLWAIPGGSIEPHETPAQAAIRECMDEVGLHVEPTQILGVYGGPDFHTIYANGDQVSYTDTVFEARITGGALTIDNDEIIEVKFVNEADLGHFAMQKLMQYARQDIVEKRLHTYFQRPTWSPPEDDQHHGGISDYIRGLRDKIGTTQLRMPASAGIVLDEQGRILLQQRSDTRLWSVPGGAIDPHETPANAVVREVWEETKLIVEPLRLSGVYSGPKDHGVYPHGDAVAICSFVFVCRIIGGELYPDEVESLDARFVEISQLDSLSIPEKWLERMEHAWMGSDFAYFDLGRE